MCIARVKWYRKVAGLSNPTRPATSSTGAIPASSNGRLACTRCAISHRIGLVPLHRAKCRR